MLTTFFLTAIAAITGNGASLFDKNMIDKLKDHQGKYLLLGRNDEKARLLGLFL